MNLNDIDKFIVDIPGVPSYLITGTSLPFYKRTWFGKLKYKPIFVILHDTYSNNISNVLLNLSAKTFSFTIKSQSKNGNLINKWTIKDAIIYDISFGMFTYEDTDIREIKIIIKYKSVIFS